MCQMLPEVTSLLCGNCDPHAETIFILPEGVKEEVEKEVKNIYSFGLTSGLKQLLGISCGKKSLKVKTENEDKNDDDADSNKIVVFDNPERNARKEESQGISSYELDIFDKDTAVPYESIKEEGVEEATAQTDPGKSEDVDVESVSKEKDDHIKEGRVCLPASYKDAKNGGKILICPDGYKYSKVKEQTKKAYYKCRNNKTDNCHVVTTVTKEDNMIVRMVGTHTHEAKSRRNEAIEIIETAVKEAVANPVLSPRKVATNISVQLDSMNLSEMQSIIKQVSIIRRITRGRQKILELSGLAIPKSWGKPQD